MFPVPQLPAKSCANAGEAAAIANASADTVQNFLIFYFSCIECRLCVYLEIGEGPATPADAWPIFETSDAI
jgi:hypothetical protein